MIGMLRGTLVSKRPPWLTLDVGGVGYELEAPMSTFYRLPDTGRELMLVTHLVVREDAHALYGFFTEAERALFRNLIKISGVGPRIALGVLSGMSVEGFYQCIRDGNSASLVKIPGVGQKTADLLLLDADPMLDIRNTRKISAVVSNGNYFDRAALDAILARAKANPRK